MEDISNSWDRHDISSIVKGLIRCLQNSSSIHQNPSIVWRSDDSRHNSWFLVWELFCCWFVSVICLRLTMNSVCFSPISVQPWPVLVDCCLKIEEFLHKMAISSAQNSRHISFFLRKLTISSASVLNIWSHSSLFCLLISSSLSLMLSSTAPFGRPSASLEFLHSLSLDVFCPRHNSSRRSLFMRVSRKEWPVPQLTGVYGMVRVPRNLDCIMLPSRSLLPWSKKSQRNRNLPSRL